MIKDLLFDAFELLRFLERCNFLLLFESNQAEVGLEE